MSHVFAQHPGAGGCTALLVAKGVQPRPPPSPGAAALVILHAARYAPRLVGGWPEGGRKQPPALP